MEFRHLGRSGLKVSEIAYGNWLTHGSQVEEEAASACVPPRSTRASPRSTPRTSTRDRAEAVLGRALHGVRRESVEIFTKVYWPTGAWRERPRPVPQAHHGVGPRFAAPPANRLRRPVPGAPVRPRDAARGDAAGVRRPRPAGQGALRRRLRVARRGDRGRAEDRRRDGPGPDRLQPAAVQHALAGDRDRGRAALRGRRASARSSCRRSPRAC